MNCSRMLTGQRAAFDCSLYKVNVAQFVRRPFVGFSVGKPLSSEKKVSVFKGSGKAVGNQLNNPIMFFGRKKSCRGILCVCCRCSP